MLVGLARPDDAAVHCLGDGRVVIVSLDFFTPIVDDPYDFGQIAAANALSDIYAMGGEPFLALSIVGFPAELPVDILTRILRGAAIKVREAGAALAGGHSVRDAEPKFGLAALGFAREEDLILKGGARPGDRLYLTKPIGTGLLSTALKNDQVNARALDEAVLWMSRLSAPAARAARAAGVRGGTDVTGFALAGHAVEMAEAAGVRLVLQWRAVPALAGARDAAAADMIPGGAHANRDAFGPRITGFLGLPEIEQALLFDPQTSGGLLLAVPAGAAATFESAAGRESAPIWPVGRVEAGVGLAIES